MVTTDLRSMGDTVMCLVCRNPVSKTLLRIFSHKFSSIHLLGTSLLVLRFLLEDYGLDCAHWYIKTHKHCSKRGLAEKYNYDN